VFENFSVVNSPTAFQGVLSIFFYRLLVFDNFNIFSPTISALLTQNLAACLPEMRLTTLLTFVEIVWGLLFHILGLAHRDDK
jgi:hypothetical protein